MSILILNHVLGGPELNINPYPDTIKYYTVFITKCDDTRFTGNIASSDLGTQIQFNSSIPICAIILFYNTEHIAINTDSISVLLDSWVIHKFSLKESFSTSLILEENIMHEIETLLAVNQQGTLLTDLIRSVFNNF
ncbi:hypothetical protein [Pedobacter cryoconitis]|nr:hypothetical protein [Pedobacter cryoconitis]